MWRSGLLFIILLSIIGLSLNCSEELSYPVNLTENYICPDNNLVITGDFNASTYEVNVSSFKLEGGKYFGSGNLNSQIIVLSSGEINVSSLSNVTVNGEVRYSSPTEVLTINNLNVTSGKFISEASSDLVVTGSIFASDLEPPTHDMEIESKIDGNKISKVKVPYSNDTHIIKYNGTWELLDIEENNSYFVLKLGEDETWFVVKSLGSAFENPVVNLISPSNGTYNKSSIIFTYSVDNSSVLAECSLYINDTLNKTDTNLSEYRFESTLEDGGWLWKVNCADVWGNSSFSEEIAFIVENDTESPYVTFEINPNKYEIPINEDVTFLCSAIDNVGVVSVKIYTPYDTICSSLSSSCSKKMSFPAEGQLEFFCEAMDSNGNSDRSSIRIKIVDLEEENEREEKNITSDEKKEDKSSLTGMYLLKEEGMLKFDLSKEDTPIKEVLMITDKETADLNVTEISPVDVPLPDGDTYSYVEITSSLSNDEIEEVKIRFIVPRSWMEEKKISEEEISLLKYSSGWKELPTRIIDKKDEYVKFESSCKGFSIFAISTKRDETNFGFAVAIVIIGAIVVIILVFFFRSGSGVYNRPVKKRYRYGKGWV